MTTPAKPPPALKKAYLQVEKSPTQIPCLFNPEQIAMNFTADWGADARDSTGGVSKTAGTSNSRAMPFMRYKGAKNATFSLDLTFDTTDTGNAVTTYTAPLIALFDISTNLPRKVSANNYSDRPATVTFVWGNFKTFAAVVTALSLKYTYFSEGGTPLRAQANLSLTQYSGATWPRQNPTSGTPNPHRVHRLQRGETLDRIAAQYYGDSTQWRHLAVANGIEDPLNIAPGALLAVPDLTA